MTAQTEINIGGKKLALSNLDKVLYPEARFTKGQVIDYYTRISPVLLPHLKDRALTMKRYPEGVDGEFFYEKRCPSFRPKWLKTAPVWSRANQANVHYCLANDLPSLVWAANLADLELHTSLARYRNPDQPTMVVFDLDPGTGADIIACTEVALWLREFLGEHELESFPKTSGSKGLQVYVPLNTRATFAETKAFARATAECLTHQHPREVLFNMSKQLRKGKVFIDWSQNDRHKTTVCVYSLRARRRPTVATPLKWDEVRKAQKSGSPERISFETEDVLRRVSKFGDLFDSVLKLKQQLPKAIGVG